MHEVKGHTSRVISGACVRTRGRKTPTVHAVGCENATVKEAQRSLYHKQLLSLLKLQGHVLRLPMQFILVYKKGVCPHLFQESYSTHHPQCKRCTFLGVNSEPDTTDLCYKNEQVSAS